jgi:hypothetical protein
MSKKHKNKKKREKRRSGGLPETRAAEALTVFWMLATLATGLAQAGAAVLVLIDYLAGSLQGLADLAKLAIFMALVTGVVALVCLPLVLRQRRTPPPRAVLIAAIVITAFPVAITLSLLAN